jgi:hypothetical protein
MDSLLQAGRIVQSHERLYSDDFILSRNTFNRTMKPMKLQRFSNIRLFLPQWSRESSESFYEIIDKKFKLKGLLANENLEMF